MEKEPCSYFQIQDMAVDPYGNLCPAYMKINITFNEDTPEDKISAIIAQMLHVEPGRIRRISEEQYLRECGDDDDDED